MQLDTRVASLIVLDCAYLEGLRQLFLDDHLDAGTKCRNLRINILSQDGSSEKEPCDNTNLTAAKYLRMRKSEFTVSVEPPSP